MPFPRHRCRKWILFFAMHFTATIFTVNIWSTDTFSTVKSPCSSPILLFVISLFLLLLFHTLHQVCSFCYNFYTPLYYLFLYILVQSLLLSTYSEPSRNYANWHTLLPWYWLLFPPHFNICALIPSTPGAFPVFNVLIATVFYLPSSSLHSHALYICLLAVIGHHYSSKYSSTLHITSSQSTDFLPFSFFHSLNCLLFHSQFSLQFCIVFTKLLYTILPFF